MEEYKNDFPMLKHDYIYLNNASTAYKPQVVIDSIVDFYNNYSVNTNRGVDSLGYKLTEKFENARKRVARYLNTKANEIVFTRGTTEGLNIVANGLSDFVNEGDEIIVSIGEHHANYLPWLELAKAKKAKFIVINDDDICKELEKNINSNTKIVALYHISNVMGKKNDIAEISKIVRKTNAYLVIDGAQGIVHEKLDLTKIDIDFYSFSGHKIYGPMGVGVLYGKENLLNKIKPLNYGGEMINIVTSKEVSYKKAPYKFEGGTMMVPEVLGLASALDYIEEIGLDKINLHIKELRAYLLSKLIKIDDIVIYNKDEIDSNLITFNIKGIHGHDIATLFDKNNIILRAGHHCAAPLAEKLEVSSTLRISFALYNTKNDCDKVIETLKKAGDFLNVLF